MLMIADKIKELREGYGWTQSDLSKKLGLSRSAVNAWEMGLSTPSTANIVDLADLFRVSADYILGLKSEIVLDISGLECEEREIIIRLVDCFVRKGQKNKLRDG